MLLPALATLPFLWPPEQCPYPLGAVSPVGVQGCGQNLPSGCGRGHAILSDYLSVTEVLTGAARHLTDCDPM